MTFLNPAFLWVLPAAVVPVLLHLLNKRPPKRLTFSYVKWLREAHETFMPKKRLRDLLLLAVRTLILLFLVLFFSRPILHQGGLFAAQSQDSAMVILADVSASMGVLASGREALEIAKEQLQLVLRRVPPSLRVGLVVYSNRVEQEIAPSTDRSQIIVAVGNLKATPRPTNVLPALELAYGMLQNQPAGRKSILVASDHAANGWVAARETAGQWANYDPEVSVAVWEVINEMPNLSIAEAFLQLSEEGTLKGRWVSSRHGSGRASTWELNLNGRVVGQGTPPVAGNRSEEVPLEAQLPEGGFYAGHLQLTPDAYRFDDAYYLAGRVPKGFRLLVVDGEGGLAPSDSEAYYLKSALESPRDPRLESIQVIRPEVLQQELFVNYDAVVLANVGDVGAKADELRKWVEAGGGLFLTAGGKWPRAPETPLKFFRSKPAASPSASLAPPSAETPYLSNIGGLSTFQWDQISVNRYFPLEDEAAITPLLSLTTGEPILVRKQVGKGFVLCLTTTIDRSWTNFPAKPLFAPLMRELVAALADPLREQTSLQGFVDEAVKVRMPAGIQNATVIAPDGSTGGARIDKDGYLVWPSPAAPGLYRVKTDKKENDFSFAVNIKNVAQEGNPRRVEPGNLKVIFRDASVDWIAYRAKGADTVLATLHGRDATKALIVALFLLVGLEMILQWLWRKREVEA